MRWGAIMKVLLAITILICFADNVSHAQSSSSASIPQAQGESSLKADETKSANKKSFHSTLQLSRSSNFYKSGSADSEVSTDLLIYPSYAFSEKLSLSAKAIITKEETQGKNTLLSNTKLGLKIAGPQITENTKSSFGIGGILPTNTQNRQTERLKGGASLSASISNISGNLNSAYTLIAQRNFHEFTVNADGAPNVEQTLAHDLTLEYAFNDSWSVSAEGIYKQGWTYKNFQRQTFSTGADLSFSFNKELSFSVGVANQGNAFKANGTESNISVYDQNTSTVSASLTFVN